MKLRFRNHIQQVVDEFAYLQASSTFPLLSSSPSASPTFNSLSSEEALPPAMPEDTYRNY
jgi:hypothetical protein